MQLNFLSWVALMLLSFSLTAQQLPIVDLPEHISFHFISPEPIQYVDISTKSIAGDIPIKNVLRIKRIPDSIVHSNPDLLNDAIVTVAGESFIAQFKIRYIPQLPGQESKAQLEILPEHMKPLETGVTLSRLQLERLASAMLFKKQATNIARVKAFGLSGNVNQLATFGEYIFVDIGFTNFTNLKYDTDELRFKIADEKITKATTNQSIEIKPEFTLFKNNAFKKNFRNIYVFKKFSLPGHKVLKIEVNEKQISGRVITLQLKYKDLLEADTL